MARAIPEAHLAGAVVVVVKDGNTLLQKGYGYADVARKVPVDPDRTLFRAGSISKLFTGTAVMQLVEEGKLDLDRDVNGYLDFAIEPAFGKPITLRNLLTHTPGFRDVLQHLLVFKPAQAESLETYVKQHQPQRIFAPGTVPAYSNYGLALAGYIVQRVSGEPFDAYIERHIFKPLGMTFSSFRQPLPPALQPAMAKGYMNPTDPPLPFEIFGPSPAGALSTSGADMAQFMIAHLQDGRYGDAKILSPETARLMHRRAFTQADALNGMALTFWEQDRNGHHILGHDGGNPVFRSNLRLFPDDNVGVFLSFNAIGPDSGVFPVRSVFLDEFIDRYFPGAPAEHATMSTAREHARMAAGIYEASDRKSSFFRVLGLFDQTEVTANSDDTIVLSSQTNLDGSPKKWREVGPFLWREVRGQDLLAMKVIDGRVVTIARSFDPAGALLPAPFGRPAWLLAAMLVSAVILLLFSISWPATALARRRYGLPPPFAGRRAFAHHLARGVALVILLYVAAWALLLQQVAAGEVELFSVGTASVFSGLRILQLLGLLGAVGSAAVLWNLWISIRQDVGWARRVSSGLLAIACLIFVWFGLASGLLDQSMRY
jgi:CubicO group peptidase (beta-lactamase class C family)